MHNRVWRLRHTHYIIKKVNCLKKYELKKNNSKLNNSTSAKPTTLAMASGTADYNILA